jgi:hypothetical protein
VHEFAEILMSQRNVLTHKTTWIPNNSMGEALAIVLQSLLHPQGYFGLTTGRGGPRIGPWLNYQGVAVDNSRPVGLRRDWSRPNYIDNTDNNDGQNNAVAVGCGILFIHYLLWLGFSLKEIIANGAATFEGVFHNLTKQSGGWKSFTDLLNLHFPEIPNSNYPVTVDNLFPLPALIKVTLSPSSVTCGETANGTVVLDAPQTATLVTLISSSPGFASVPANCTIPFGRSTGAFVVSTPWRFAAFPAETVEIWASYGGSSVVAQLKVHSPLEAQTGILSSLTVSPSTVVGGAESVGTVTLESAVSTDVFRRGIRTPFSG